MKHNKEIQLLDKGLSNKDDYSWEFYRHKMLKEEELNAHKGHLK